LRSGQSTQRWPIPSFRWPPASPARSSDLEPADSSAVTLGAIASHRTVDPLGFSDTPAAKGCFKHCREDSQVSPGARSRHQRLGRGGMGPVCLAPPGTCARPPRGIPCQALVRRGGMERFGTDSRFHRKGLLFQSLAVQGRVTVRKPQDPGFRVQVPELWEPRLLASLPAPRRWLRWNRSKRGWPNCRLAEWERGLPGCLAAVAPFQAGRIRGSQASASACPP
jgi:hypothetical protein